MLLKLRTLLDCKNKKRRGGRQARVTVSIPPSRQVKQQPFLGVVGAAVDQRKRQEIYARNAQCERRRHSKGRTKQLKYDAASKVDRSIRGYGRVGTAACVSIAWHITTRLVTSRNKYNSWLAKDKRQVANAVDMFSMRQRTVEVLWGLEAKSHEQTHGHAAT